MKLYIYVYKLYLKGKTTCYACSLFTLIQNKMLRNPVHSHRIWDGMIVDLFTALNTQTSLLLVWLTS